MATTDDDDRAFAAVLRGVAASPELRPPLRPGDVLAERFAVVGFAGAGGMGRVYRATDLGSGRDVDLKVLVQRTELAQQRFEREARVLADLEHQSIVRYLLVPRRSGNAPKEKTMERPKENRALGDHADADLLWAEVPSVVRELFGERAWGEGGIDDSDLLDDDET